MTTQELTEEQKRGYLEEACRALEHNRVKGTQAMRDEYGGRCCLCVMMDTMIGIAARDGVTLTYDKSADYKNFPPREMGDFYGLPALPGRSVSGPNTSQFDFLLDGHAASLHNDGLGLELREKTHAEIADMIRKQYLSQ